MADDDNLLPGMLPVGPIGGKKKQPPTPTVPAPASPQPNVLPGMVPVGGVGAPQADTGSEWSQQGLKDFARVAASSGTLGASDYLYGDHAQALKDLQAARDRLGMLQYAADIAGYAATSIPTGGFGAEAALGRTALGGATSLLGRIGAGAARGALEGAGTTGVSSLVAHPEDPGAAIQNALVGGVTGGVTGGAVARAPGYVKATAPQDATAALKTQTQQAYRALDPITFDSSDALAAMNRVQNSLSPSERSAMRTGSINSTVNAVGQEIGGVPGVTISANDLNSMARQIREAGARGDALDGSLARRYSDALKGVMDNATPVSGHAVGEAGAASNWADRLAGRAKASAMIDDFRENPTAAPAKAQKAIDANSDMFTGPNADPVAGAAMQTIASAAPNMAQKAGKLGFEIGGPAIAGHVFGGPLGFAMGGLGGGLYHYFLAKNLAKGILPFEAAGNYLTGISGQAGRGLNAAQAGLLSGAQVDPNIFLGSALPRRLLRTGAIGAVQGPLAQPDNQ